jgi:6-phosphogluconate dehydrogenase (decarboxylating)
MELGIIGLGRMSANMTERLVLGGHRLISCDGYVEDSGEGR